MKLLFSSPWVMVLTLLLLTVFAPACAPNDPPPSVSQQNLVLLTDTTHWQASDLHQLQDSLMMSGYRVITSGYPGESTEEIMARLPWLLQPGVDVLLYDDRLAGAATFDSLLLQMKVMSPHTEVLRWVENR